MIQSQHFSRPLNILLLVKYFGGSATINDVNSISKLERTSLHRGFDRCIAEGWLTKTNQRRSRDGFIFQTTSAGEKEIDRLSTMLNNLKVK